MSTQAPVKVSQHTKDRIKYLAALTDTTQADIVDRAVTEFAARHTEDIAAGISRARDILAGGDAAIAAAFLGESPEAIARIAGE